MEKTVVVSVSVKLKKNVTLYMDVLVMSYLGLVQQSLLLSGHPDQKPLFLQARF